jgi:hypothetical protein
MRAHLSIADVQGYGCAALWTLASNANNKVAIADAGGIGAVVSAMQFGNISVGVFPVQEATRFLANQSTHPGHTGRYEWRELGVRYHIVPEIDGVGVLPVEHLFWSPTGLVVERKPFIDLIIVVEQDVTETIFHQGSQSIKDFEVMVMHKNKCPVVG